jgi:hypothetical protein
MQYKDATPLVIKILKNQKNKLDAKTPTRHFNQTYENITSAAAFQPSKIT